MAIMSAVLGQPERDPALLAFIKCHLTSMARWNILRVLSEDPGYHWSVDEVARQAHGSGDITRRSLEELADEGLVERYAGPLGPTYTLDGSEPTARVLVRLQIEAGRNQGLRQIIVARMLEGGSPIKLGQSLIDT
jgi:DNA-binding MarR family transcriptional regulator